MELTYDEIVEIFDVIYNNGTAIEYVLPPGIYEIIDNISMINSLLPLEGKVNITINDIRLRTKLTTKKTINFTRKSFLYIILGFT